MQLVSGGQTAVAVNGEIGPYFRNKRGLRQGDPIFPLLFNFIVDALPAMLDRAREAGYICGVASHLILGGFHSYNMRTTRCSSLSPTTIASCGQAYSHLF